MRAAVRETGPWIGRLARAGFIAKAVIYLIVGGLTASVAWHGGRRGADANDALRTIAARGVLFIIIAVFLIRASLQHDASEARGVRRSLSVVATQRSGPVLLGAASAGLMAYGMYQLMHTKYGRIREN